MIAAIRTELGEAVDAVNGLTGYARRPTSPRFPCCVIGPPLEVTYTARYGGQLKLTGVATVYVNAGTSTFATADQTLDNFMSPDSVPAALRGAAGGDTIKDVRVLIGTNWREDTLTIGDDTFSLIAADIPFTITTNES